jgi:hypothetical protein
MKSSSSCDNKEEDICIKADNSITHLEQSSRFLRNFSTITSSSSVGCGSSGSNVVPDVFLSDTNTPVEIDAHFSTNKSTATNNTDASIFLDNYTSSV